MTDTKSLSTKSQEDPMRLADEFTDALLFGEAGKDESALVTDPAALDWSLVKLIRDLSETLLPVEPSSVFVEDLRKRLNAVQTSMPETQETSPQARGQWISTIVSMFTIIGIASHVIGAVVLLTAILLKRRRQASPA